MRRISTKINIDKIIIKTLFIVIGVKLLFSYLNVDLDWWQRHLTPNIEKYNFLNLTRNFNRKLEYIIIPLIIIYLVKNYKILGRVLLPVLIIVSLFLLNIITSYLTDVSLLESVEYTIKFSSPIGFFSCLIIHKRKYDYNIEKKVKFFILYCLILVVFGILVFDPSYNHWRNWLPIYFTSLHTHNYILVSIAIGIGYMLYKNGRYLYLCAFLISYFLFLYFGYRIRSALFFYLIFAVGITYVIHDFFKMFWVKLIVIVPIILAFYLAINSGFDLNRYSSGRVTMYKAKIEMLKEYSASEYLFGRGKGSDFIRTKDWWYEKKNSHNDVLTFLIENGIVYAGLFIFLILSLIIFSNKVNIITASVLFGYLSASFLSNGLPLRPLAGYILFLMLAYIHSEIHAKSSYRKEPE